MIHTDMPNKKIHQGRNIKRFREMLGIKQEALAFELGDDWNQKKISLLEQKESVEKDILEQVAKILKVPTEAIENFDEEQVVNIISNTVNNSDNASGNSLYNYYPTFNPIDKVVELYDEKVALYERMLKEKDEMMARLEKLIEGK
ncbi:helix-turn-helix domain-containing protein [Elizabethkingia meningoseptica]|uniref:helix-turn-helix domain-containing protein n=1 Tax=Elizabethkingia meningoseptica TaxID=238 RepID=UPI0023AF3DC3|nr:helix-turn-helix transcriptional regulator [Elizabethkingia meningoseptica]MDE5436352.1 helix-turn-helix domain-containing protein [Elizabethkingia meningoseptica]MDE5508448.1 helix-turn-helix domain-containing protein [Elizabethkingia meningoseptica]MDE5515156.1 helix-turn-helix domain-containing protein [Elizabethkingia meningoseptica]MDE5529422.1 helix-turn-helix domain-containing protein [Elizabethkingia meningoseptica]MDE5532978.1 helix-turn-helix domain-containing protein [Elizabethki